MPEYLAPGAYVEETSFRPKTIEGVGTSTAGFVGATRFGPTAGEPELLNNLSDFERIYGGLDRLEFDGAVVTNYLAQAVRAFFEEGGKRLYVSRVSNSPVAATAEIGGSPAPIQLAARHPGTGGNVRVTFTLRHTDNLYSEDTGAPRLLRAKAGDTVAVYRGGNSPAEVVLYDVVESSTDEDVLEVTNDDGGTRSLRQLAVGDNDKVVLLSMDVEIERPIDRPKRPQLRFTTGEVYEGLAFHPDHNRGLQAVFPVETQARRVILRNPLKVVIDDSVTTGYGVAETMFDTAALAKSVAGEEVDLADLQTRVTLAEGTDGCEPASGDFAGTEDGEGLKSGLLAFEDLEDISIVAAPGSSTLAEGRAAQGALVAHAERMRYRIAVMDTPDGQTLGDVRAYRGEFDSKYAAMYYPWIRVIDTVTEEELILPPSGFVAGIYARNDENVGVHRTPANEVVRLAIGFEQLINKSQQDVLNPEGVNCFRFFEGRGYRLWGGRTISSDGEFKYVSTRRYLAYLEASIDRGTQVFVFENNGPKLWSNVQLTVAAFLFNEWKNNRLLGSTPEQAYFVRCGLDTMTQNDLDDGRLVCEIGVSLLKPAEFVIFRIGQKLRND